MGCVYYEIFERDDYTASCWIKAKKCLNKVTENLASETLLVVLFFEDSILDCAAEVLQLKAQLRDFDCLQEFKVYQRHCFKNFNARQQQMLITHLLQDEINIDMYVKQGVIKDAMFLHDDKKQALIEKQIYHNLGPLLFGFVFFGYTKKVKALDYIADYFGEKQSFYFAWLLHYTSWLLLPSICGLIIFLI
jgi:hypothetical protein